ncbi:hypothetical protein ACP0GZ_08175 [Escherichia coli]|nr:hypothetical protein [Escherichia coli]NYY77775.1 hypothetical protein [Escherichia coli]NYY77973.1 hypothetical protein [Escherichia coli]NYY79242.1 hypothetical protein [Escherichia coli]
MLFIEFPASVMPVCGQAHKSYENECLY